MAILFFLYFATVIIISGILTVALKDVVQSAVALLTAFIHIAGIYILLGAEFIAAVQLVVYSGAILVLYLFVVMLFNVHSKETSFHKQLPISLLLAAAIFFELFMILNKGWFSEQSKDPVIANLSGVGNTEAIGTLLYTQYLYPFEIASVILLVALMGAILLSGRIKKEKGNYGSN